MVGKKPLCSQIYGFVEWFRQHTNSNVKCFIDYTAVHFDMSHISNMQVVLGRNWSRTRMSHRGLAWVVLHGGRRFNFAVLPKHLLQYRSKLHAVIKLMDVLHLLNGDCSLIGWIHLLDSFTRAELIGVARNLSWTRHSWGQKGRYSTPNRPSISALLASGWSKAENGGRVLRRGSKSLPTS